MWSPRKANVRKTSLSPVPDAQLTVAKDESAIGDLLVRHIWRMPHEWGSRVEAKLAFFENKAALVGEMGFTDVVSQRDGHLLASGRSNGDPL
jgi:hypothetical protein